MTIIAEVVQYLSKECRQHAQKRCHSNTNDVSTKIADLKYMVLTISDVDYRGITADNQLHYRGNPTTRYSIPAVLPQNLRENTRYYRGYRGNTAVPITVQLPRWGGGITAITAVIPRIFP